MGLNREAGLDEYQVRSWQDMTMTLLAMLFLLNLQIELKNKAPRLTIQDAREILMIVLPKPTLTLEEAIQYLEMKHRKRNASRRSHLPYDIVVLI